MRMNEIIFSALLLDMVGDIVGEDAATVVGDIVGTDAVASVGGGGSDDGGVGGGHGVSNGKSSMTCKMGGSMPDVESRVPMTVAAKPWVWFPVLSHELHTPNLRAAEITSSFPLLSSTTS